MFVYIKQTDNKRSGDTDKRQRKIAVIRDATLDV